MSDKQSAAGPLPLAKLLNESWDLIVRESDVLVPVALSLFTLGHAGIIIAAGRVVRAEVDLFTVALIFGAGAILLLGRLAVTRLVLTPGTSVSEALWHAVPKIAFGLWVLVMVWLSAALVAILSLALLGVDLGKGPEALAKLGGWALAPAYAAILLLNARLLLFNPALTEGKSGMAALKQAWSLSSGKVIAFLGLVMLFMLMSETAQLVASVLVSVVMSIISAALGETGESFAVLALGAGMAAAIPSLVATVYAARVYRYVAGDSA